MAQLAQPLYLVSTAAFAVIALVVSARLIRLSFRSGQAPERLMGLGILGTAVLGYAFMMVGLIAGRSAADGGEPSAPFVAITALGWIFHNVGVLCMLRFIIVVFRPDDRVAKAVAVVMSIVLWLGWLGYAWQGNMATGLPDGPYWIAFTVIGSYPLWNAAESFRYHRLMRRRLALGLADPLVTDRFRLWALASLCAAASIWIVNLPSLLGVEPGSRRAEELMAICMLFTSAFGIATVSIYWLTFLPPRWYRRLFDERDAAAASARTP